MQENGTHRGLSTHFSLDVSDAVAADLKGALREKGTTCPGNFISTASSVRTPSSFLYRFGIRLGVRFYNNSIKPILGWINFIPFFLGPH